MKNTQENTEAARPTVAELLSRIDAYCEAEERKGASSARPTGLRNQQTCEYLERETVRPQGEDAGRLFVG